MSQSIEVHAVKPELLKRILGSRSMRRANHINRESKDEFDNIREQLDDDRDPEDFTYEDAVRDLVFGEFRDDEDWHIYGYAIQAILDTYADYQGNWCPITNTQKFQSCFNRILSDHGVELMMEDLFMMGGPKDFFPDPDDIPMWGSWGHDACSSASAPLAAIDIDSLNVEDRAIIRDVVSWVRVAARRKSMLIGMLT